MAWRVEVRIAGGLDDGLSRAVLAGIGEPEIDTVVCGAVADQAALHQMLERIQQHGLEVVGFTCSP